MRLALAQLNPVVGDIAGNAEAISTAYRSAVAAGASLVVTGELAITGYPPDDLVLKPAFVRQVAATLEELAGEVGATPLIVGFVEDLGDARVRRAVLSEAVASVSLANAAAVLCDGRVTDVYRKQRIPNYGVFDEARYFSAGTDLLLIDVDGTPVGVTICEDLWGEGGPATAAAKAGAEIVLNLNASPYHQEKRAQRERWATHHTDAGRMWLAYVNLVGGQDEVVFDGDSFVMGPDGVIIARAAQFETDLLLVDLDAGAPAAPAVTPRLEPVAEVYDALVLSTRDYLGKNGFPRAIVGVSGGIDSALTAAVAVDALGPDAVQCVAMPSPYSSPGSLTDAEALVRALGAQWLELPIKPMMDAFAAALSEPFAGTPPGVAEENIQSRIRGALLMALSNKHGGLVLTTGNKSEYAVGYATLYGDMAGGFAVIKDVYKTLVYELSRYRNEGYRPLWRGPRGEVIPRTTLEKAPSAELRPGQVDTDSLPDYDTLDAILVRYVEHLHSVEDITAEGYDGDLVRGVARLVDRAEYKRRQAAPGVKVTRRAFGRDRRLPITQSWTR